MNDYHTYDLTCVLLLLEWDSHISLTPLLFGVSGFREKELQNIDLQTKMQKHK